MSNPIANNWFPILVCLSTVGVFAPIIITVMKKFLARENFLETSDIGVNLRIYPVVGLTFSLPLCIISFILFKFLIKNNKSALFIKICLSTFFIVGLYTTSLLMELEPLTIYNLPYLVGIITMTSVFRVYKKTNLAIS